LARPDDCAEVRRALEQSLDILGESSKKALLRSLLREFNISLEDENCSSAQEIQKALEAIFGAGASVLMAEFYRNLGAGRGSRRQVRGS
jgi:hypothetical protein